MLSDKTEIIPVKALQVAFEGYLDRKGSGSAVTPRQESIEDLLESAAVEGLFNRRAGEGKSATRHCTRLTTRNLIKYYQALPSLVLPIHSLIAIYQ